MTAGDGVYSQIDEIHRAEWARSVARLCRLSGDVQLAEDCVQEAFVIAVKVWERSGMPDNPGGWIRTVARRRLIDFARRRRTQVSGAVQLLIDAEVNSSNQADDFDSIDRAIDDDELALIFLCCHPAISVTDQVMLTLRVVAGMAPRDIAHAFFAGHEAVRTRLLRAKRKIKSAKIPMGLPPAEQLAERFQQVQAVIYLIFNEGYLSNRGGHAQRMDLTRESIRLCEKLLTLAPGNQESHGLFALLLLTDARAPARIGESDNELVALEDQDRELWRKDQIVAGFYHLQKAMKDKGQVEQKGKAQQDALGRYAVQAAIAAEHAKAARYSQTNWAAIVQWYDRLIAIENSPVYYLNRCVALSFTEGPNSALQGLAELSQGSLLADSYQLHATRANLLARIGRLKEAIAHYHLAIAQLDDGAIKSFLQQRIEQLQKATG
jgi:RNA polymerase sigma-70 factor (ECF subfamily)